MDSSSGTAPSSPNLFTRRPVVWASLRTALALTSIAEIAAAAWLVLVCVTVLPARDPAHVSLWLTVAVAAFAHAALSARVLVDPAHSRWAAPLLALLSLAAATAGVSVVTISLRAAHFEGYLVLLGLIAGVHGLCAFGYAIGVTLAGRTTPTPH